MVSPPEFLVHNPAGQFLRLFGSINRDRPPLLENNFSPASGDNDLAGEEQGSLDGDQIPAVQIFDGFDMAQQDHSTENFACMFQKYKHQGKCKGLGLQNNIKAL